MINISAGLALEGYKVFAYAIAPFITMRCFEQIRVSLALLSEVRAMNVNLIGVGAGYSYVVSGPTPPVLRRYHADAGYAEFSSIVASRSHNGGGAFRQVCGRARTKISAAGRAGIAGHLRQNRSDMTNGFNVHRGGGAMCIVATGYMLHTALTAADHLQAAGIQVGLIDLFDLARFAKKPLYQELRRYDTVVSMEEGFVGRGGLDSLLYNLLGQHEVKPALLNIGVDRYRFELGSRSELHELAGIGVDVVTRQLLELSSRTHQTAKLQR